MSCLKSLSSLVMLIYVVPIDMQPKSGDTSKIVQTPQNAKRSATEMMRRLSVERVFGRSMYLSAKPKRQPSSSSKPAGQSLRWKKPPRNRSRVPRIWRRCRLGVPQCHPAPRLEPVFLQNHLLRLSAELSSLWRRGPLQRQGQKGLWRTQCSDEAQNR